MKILVTGGAGFLGSNLCEALLDKNYEVVCVDNLITGNKKNIEEFLKDKKFVFIKHDVVELLNKNLGKIDQIYHLASPASPKDYFAYPLETMMTSSQGTYNLLKLACKLSAKFLFASTSEVYGDPKVHPQKETYSGNVDPTVLRSAYDESKRFAEAQTMLFVRKYDLDARIVRIFNTYGPRMRLDDGRPMPTFINQVLQQKPLTIQGDGKQTRSFCFVSDLVDGLILAMEKAGTRGEVFNLGNPDERSIIDLAKIIKDTLKSKSEIVFVERYPNDPERRRPDIAKARKILGWEPKISLEKGLDKTINYFKNG